MTSNGEGEADAARPSGSRIEMATLLKEENASRARGFVDMLVPTSPHTPHIAHDGDLGEESRNISDHFEMEDGEDGYSDEGSEDSSTGVSSRGP